MVPDHDKLILMGLQQWVDPHTSFDVEFYTGRPLTQPSQGFVSPLSVEAGIFSLLTTTVCMEPFFILHKITFLSLHICSVSLLSTFIWEQLKIQFAVISLRWGNFFSPGFSLSTLQANFVVPN